jgi:hypothetical protein
MNGLKKKKTTFPILQIFSSLCGLFALLFDINPFVYFCLHSCALEILAKKFLPLPVSSSVSLMFSSSIVSGLTFGNGGKLES